MNDPGDLVEFEPVLTDEALGVLSEEMIRVAEEYEYDAESTFEEAKAMGAISETPDGVLKFSKKRVPSMDRFARFITLDGTEPLHLIYTIDAHDVAQLTIHNVRRHDLDEDQCKRIVRRFFFHGFAEVPDLPDYSRSYMGQA